MHWKSSTRSPGKSWKATYWGPGMYSGKLHEASMKKSVGDPMKSGGFQSLLPIEKAFRRFWLWATVERPLCCSKLGTGEQLSCSGSPGARLCRRRFLFQCFCCWSKWFSSAPAVAPKLPGLGNIFARHDRRILANDAASLSLLLFTSLLKLSNACVRRFVCRNPVPAAGGAIAWPGLRSRKR